MEFWFLFAGIALFIYFVSLFFYEKNYARIISHIYVFYIWFISSFRYQIGTDYDTYEKVYYANNPDGIYLMLKEPTFRFFVWVFNELGFTSQMFFLTYETILVFFYMLV